MKKIIETFSLALFLLVTLMTVVMVFKTLSFGINDVTTSIFEIYKINTEIMALAFFYWLPLFGLLPAIFIYGYNRVKLILKKKSNKEIKKQEIQEETYKAGMLSLIGFSVLLNILPEENGIIYSSIAAILLIGCTSLYWVDAKRVGHSVLTAFAVWIAKRFLFALTPFVIFSFYVFDKLVFDVIQFSILSFLLVSYWIIHKGLGKKYTTKIMYGMIGISFCFWLMFKLNGIY